MTQDPADTVTAIDADGVVADTRRRFEALRTIPPSEPTPLALWPMTAAMNALASCGLTAWLTNHGSRPCATAAIREPPRGAQVSPHGRTEVDLGPCGGAGVVGAERPCQ